MTDTIDAPAAVKPINHWIDGGAFAGESGRTGPVYNPATGVQSGAVDFASVEEIDRAVQAAKRALPEWRSMSLAKRAELFFRDPRALPRASARSSRKLLTAEHGKVLSDAMGEVTRGLEVIEFCCGIPHLLKGEMTRAGVDRRRRLLDPAAARRRRRHHAVQLPGDGADVDVGARARVRQHVRARSRRRRTRRPRSSRRSC